MTSNPSTRGWMAQHDHPEWQPLLDLAPDVVGDFMWMNEIEMEDGRRLHAYKHIDTRRYVHLCEDGTAFVYTPPGCPWQVDPRWLLHIALEPLKWLGA